MQRKTHAREEEEEETEYTWRGRKKREGRGRNTNAQKALWSDLRRPDTGCWAQTRFPLLADISPPPLRTGGSHFRLDMAMRVLENARHIHLLS